MNLAKIFGKEAAAQADIDHFTGRIDRIRAASAGKNCRGGTRHQRPLQPLGQQGPLRPDRQ